MGPSYMPTAADLEGSDVMNEDKNSLALGGCIVLTEIGTSKSDERAEYSSDCVISVALYHLNLVGRHLGNRSVHISSPSSESNAK